MDITDTNKRSRLNLWEQKMQFGIMLFDDHYYFLFQIATRLYRAASFQQLALMIYLALNPQLAKNQEHPQYVNQLDFCDLYATRHHQIIRSTTPRTCHNQLQ